MHWKFLITICFLNAMKNQMNFRKLSAQINVVTASNQQMIYPYGEQKFLLIITGTYKETLANNQRFKNSVVSIGSAENTGNRKFYELYNEINLEFISES